MLRLFPGECILKKFACGTVLLTTHRVATGVARISCKGQFILLANLSSCTCNRKRSIWSLILSLISGMMALYAGLHNWRWSALLFLSGSISGVILYYKRRYSILLRSGQKTLRIHAYNMKKEQVLQCIVDIQRARTDRIDQLKAMTGDLDRKI